MVVRIVIIIVMRLERSGLLLILVTVLGGLPVRERLHHAGLLEPLRLLEFLEILLVRVLVVLVWIVLLILVLIFRVMVLVCVLGLIFLEIRLVLMLLVHFLRRPAVSLLEVHVFLVVFLLFRLRLHRRVDLLDRQNHSRVEPVIQEIVFQGFLLALFIRRSGHLFHFLLEIERDRAFLLGDARLEGAFHLELVL